MMEYQSVDLYYEEHGQGTPVVCLHGFPFDHTIWNPLLPWMQSEARLILPDLRGFGASPAPEGVYSMRLMAEDVARLLDRLAIEKAVILGHSMGGYISLAFAHAYPTRLSGLGLVASHSFADTPERRQGRLKTASLVKRRGVKVVADGMIASLTPRADLIPNLMAIMLRASPTGVQGALKGMAERPDMTGELSNICAPAVALAGTADKLLNLEHVKTMTQMLSLGYLVEIQNGGHMLMMEEPQQTAEALLPIVRRAGA